MATDESSGFLLDTHAFLWLTDEKDRVPAELRKRLEVPTTLLWLSVASVWEMAIKRSLGKLATAAPLETLIARQCEVMAVGLLEITAAHALIVDDLPFHHRDPFDRLLVAQAMQMGLGLVSRDRAFDAYGVQRYW